MQLTISNYELTVKYRLERTDYFAIARNDVENDRYCEQREAISK